MRTSRASRVAPTPAKPPETVRKTSPSSPPCRDWPDCLTVFQITGIPHIQAGSARDAFFAADGGKTLSIEGGKRGIMGLPDDYILPDNSIACHLTGDGVVGPLRVCRRWSWRSKKLGHSLPKVSPHRVVQGSPTRRPRTRCRRRAARARQLWEDAENVTNRTGQPPERPADVRDVRPILVGNATGVYEQQDVSARYLEFEKGMSRRLLELKT